MTFDSRTNGILLHLTSLPSKYGIGTLGEESYKFVDFLYRSNVKIWQLLPIGVTSYGDSPYQSFSTNGLNYYFIDLDILKEKGLLTQEEINEASLEDENKRKVNYAKQYHNRIPLLKKAFERFDKKNKEFERFVIQAKYSDFAFYMTLKSINDNRPWLEFQEEYRIYSQQLEEKIIKEHYHEYLFYIWTQYEFLNQFKKLKKYANDRGIKLMGDMPIYISLDSVDCYKHPELFQFDEDRRPIKVAGCPPDVFSPLGQLWGNPLYNFDYMKKDNYKWMHDRFDNILETFDILRIDHFRGFASYYTIPYQSPDARNGSWVEGPRFDLFKGYTDLPIVAEDLGFLTEDVKELLRNTNFPGMKILEFAYDGDDNNPFRPTNCDTNFIMYTGTHDNLPLCGYLSSLNDYELGRVKDAVRRDCLSLDVDYDDSSLIKLNETMCKLVYASKQICAILPLQDLLSMGNESRMNTPSTLSDNNWSFRFLPSDFKEETIEFIKKQNQRYNR